MDREVLKAALPTPGRFGYLMNNIAKAGYTGMYSCNLIGEAFGARMKEHYRDVMAPNKKSPTWEPWITKELYPKVYADEEPCTPKVHKDIQNYRTFLVLLFKEYCLSELKTTREEFVKGMDRAINIIATDGGRSSCVVVSDCLGELLDDVPAFDMYDEVMSYKPRTLFWVKYAVDDGVVDQEDVGTLRLTLVLLFKEMCLAEKLYEEF